MSGPPRRWSADAWPYWALAFALLVLGLTATGGALLMRYARGLQEDAWLYKAFDVARAAARLTEAAGGNASPHLRAFGNAVGESGPEVLRLVVIDAGDTDEFGVRGGASTLWAMHGTDSSLSPLDRPLSDRASHLATRFTEAGRSRPMHLFELAEVYAAEPGMLRVAAVAPVVVNAELEGIAGALVRVPESTAPFPWALLALGAGLCLLGAAAFRISKLRPIYTAGALCAVGAIAGALWLPAELSRLQSDHLRTRAQNMLQVQGWADAHEPVALAAPIGGREAWSGDGALRLERTAGNATAEALSAEHPRVGGPAASVHLHPSWASALSATPRVDLAVWALAIALLLGLLLAPIARLAHGIHTQPGVYAYTLPSIAGMLVLVIIPFVTGVGLSFYRYHLEGNAYEFIGMGNFAEIVAPEEGSDINFWWTLMVTVLWTASNVFLHVTIGLALALLLNRPNLRGRKFYRTLLVLPWAIPNYITALMWRSMFIGERGPVNSALGFFGLEPLSWFDDNFWTNFIPNLVANTWLGFPFMMVVSLGALQSIPTGLYEAAQLDGATKWQQFRNITLPLLKPALLPAVILGTIWTFNMFNIIYLVSMGGGGTEILITDAYRAFHEQHRHGFAAAYSVLIFLILLSYTAVTNRVAKATEGAMG